MAESFRSFSTPRYKVKYPHVHLSFDDHSVSSWYGVRNLLKKYGATAVFYVDSFHLLSEEDMQMLRELRFDGHVIGCHGKTHADAIAYSRQYNVDFYLKKEVIPAMEYMESMGFPPTHFAFPYSHFDEILYDAVSSLFCYVRPGNESHYYQNGRMHFSPYRISKEETPRETRIREGGMDEVIRGLRESAKDEKGISIVFHDVRYAGERAHAGTHAGAHVSRIELEEVLEAIKNFGFKYETFESACKYGGDSFDKPNTLL